MATTAAPASSHRNTQAVHPTGTKTKSDASLDFSFLNIISPKGKESTECSYSLPKCAQLLVILVKDHRQRIPRFVIRRHLEKSIQKKLFCHLQSLQIKTIFQEKKRL